MSGRYPVFTYGSLKAGLENSMILSNSILIGGSVTVDRFKMISVDGMYPAIFKDYDVPERHAFSEGRIQGELYLVDEDTRGYLDRLERVGEFYTCGEFPIEEVVFKTKNKNYSFESALVYTALPEFLDEILKDPARMPMTSEFISKADDIVSWIHPVFPDITEVYEGAQYPNNVTAQLLRGLWNHVNPVV